jgi:SAM-dependent methyltransferase
MTTAGGAKDTRRPDNPARPYVPDVTPNATEQPRKSPRRGPSRLQNPHNPQNPQNPQNPKSSQEPEDSQPPENQQHPNNPQDLINQHEPKTIQIPNQSQHDEQPPGGDTRPSNGKRPSHSDEQPPASHNPRDWNATDEQGYFYRDPDREPANPFFAQPLRDYVLRELGGPVSVLQAGCLAPLRELGIGALEEGGFHVSVTLVDDDTPLARRVLAEVASAYDDVLTGDLRTAPIPQRAFDVIYCARLLERVRNVEVVLDRLVSALKPGGLLLIRMGDRGTASALLDRRLPRPIRRALWKNLHPGVPGPFPAVYEKSVTGSGIHSYTLVRGLVIAQHAAKHTAEPTTQTNRTRLSSSVRTICGIISWVTRGRFGADHDELLYVIRKPQDRFARVV